MTAVEELLYVLDESFSGKGIEETGESQSLLGNLATVDDAAWRALPPGGTRSIESIALHVGTCKLMYDEFAFGVGTRAWDDPDIQPWPTGEAPRAETIEWLEDLHATIRGHVAALSDEELDVPRKTSWGEMRETRWLVSTLIQHDTYHAGEINHIRSLLAGDDRWRWG
ncbi:MAG: DinB family protein [Actinomycetota bacterium]